MRVIFLDIDGVLITAYTARLGFAKVDPNCVAALNELVAATGAVLVISSCWRIGRTLEELREMVRNWGITGELLDRTGKDVDTRGKEISAWLKTRTDVDAFIILDDCDDMGDLLPRLVQTTSDTGLTKEHVAQAVKLMSLPFALEALPPFRVMPT